MNKKFLSAILFGALMVTSTGTFVSCKDYDEDIDSINKELTDIKSQLAALQTKVDAGKWITGVTTTANGVAITMSDGQTLNITNGKDGQNGAAGAQGEAGKDGKDGSVVEVKDGVLCINGVATEIKVAKEAPAALPCVKVEDGKLMVLGADGKYAATGIEAGAVTAAKTNGVWTITVDGEEIVVPGSAALTSIAIQEVENFVLNYSKLATATAWGWKQTDGTYDESMPAGFYTRLSGDVEVLLNPAEADGTAFTYTFKNSKGENAGVKFFGEARPSTKVLYSRAASENGLWTLPAAITKFDAADINEMRNELYLTFKQNDGKAYAMTLEAADGLGNVAVRSDYNYTVTLKQASGSASIDEMKGLEIGKVYYPSIVGPVYDYKIRVAKGTSNERYAKAFGIEITEDGKGFSAANDAAVLNAIKFEYAYVTIAGYATSSTFSASFTDGMTASENLRAEAFKAPFNASLANAYDKGNVSYAPSAIASFLEEYKTYGTSKASKEKVFVMKHKYDLSTLYAGLSEDAKMLFDENIGAAVADLIGGEAGDVEDNYNAKNRNAQLLNNIVVGKFDATKKEIEVSFYVSENWLQPTTGDLKDLTDAQWDAYANFQLNTAYQLNLTVSDAVSGDEVAVIELPFELTEPTLDIAHQNGEFTQWGSYLAGYNADKTAIEGNALYAYAAIKDNKAYLPLYDSFTTWMEKGSFNFVTGKYTHKVENAEYYTLTYTRPYGAQMFGDDNSSVAQTITLDEAIQYSSKFHAQNTWVGLDYVKPETLVNPNTGKVAIEQTEFASELIKVSYKHYGVYEEYPRDAKGKADGDFYLVFASWLNHSTLAMAEEEYETADNTNVLFITNDDLNFTTPMGDAFYLFDGLKANGKVNARVNLNESFDEEDGYPFTTVAQLASNDDEKYSAKATDGTETFDVVARMIAEDEYARFVVENNKTGEREWNLDGFTADDNNVKVYIANTLPRVDANNQAGELSALQGGLFIVLPKSVETGEKVTLTVKLNDAMGYTKSFDIVVEQNN